ncbi:alpha/beta fold hydrolase [Sphingobium sp. WTD-1]|uniref:alpha/beta fold hydrolase n=1 Tax=Sphingobium sp. WTD-1 TaxID=2979467 RepID=UPI0024DE1AAE|nr:alpha/beta fold hydrolase [Sphingobium sp. WTD-1]WIA54583.1 alpha/beta fold hydrolase [Sphingobium sp. WTD-1]
MRRRAFIGLRRYQEARRPPPPPPAPVAATAGHARLLRYGSDLTQQSDRVPIVFIPSLINPPQVLDLSERQSMLRHMAAAGHDIHLVDWGTPTAADRLLDLDAHITERLIPMIAALPRPPILVGYCLGGTLAIAAAALHRIAALATIAAPWNFAGFPATDLNGIAALWRDAKAVCDRLGYVPMEALQSGFWALDPQRTVLKYAAFADMTPDSDEEHAFLAVEDWANEGAPLTFAAGQQLFETLYAANASGRNEWRIGGTVITPDAIRCPALSIASATDRIVPASAAPPFTESRTLHLGHVGMILSQRAPELLWHPLSLWLSQHGG